MPYRPHLETRHIVARRARAARTSSSIHLGSLVIAALAAVLGACGGGGDRLTGPGNGPNNTPKNPGDSATVQGSPPPAALVGVWRFGYASDYGYTDPATGQWTPGHAQTASKTFHSNGQAEFAYLDKVTVEQCWTSIFRYWTGTVAVRDGQWTFDITTATEKGDGNCGVTPYTKPLATGPDIEDWKIDDQSNPPALWVKAPQDTVWHGPFELQPSR